MRLQGARVWVTGAGKGIGAAIATALAGQGARVALTSRTKADLTHVAGLIEQAGGTAIVREADVSVESSVSAAAHAILENFGGLDILVNNAGIGRFAPVTSLSLEDFDRMWSVNMRGVFLCTRAVLPAMQQGGSGIIVNMASLAGKNAFVNGAGYAATKWALLGFSNCLRLEVRSSNIKVITICPGTVATEFSPSSNSAERRDKVLHAEDVAAAVIGALSLPNRAMMSEIDLRPTNPA